MDGDEPHPGPWGTCSLHIAFKGNRSGSPPWGADAWVQLGSGTLSWISALLPLVRMTLHLWTTFKDITTEGIMRHTDVMALQCCGTSGSWASGLTLNPCPSTDCM